MAIIQNPLSERISGSYGNAVLVNKYGKTYLRLKPFNFKDAKTPKQLARRERLRIANMLIKPVLPVIREAYAGILTSMSPYNKAISLIMKGAYAGDSPVLDHSKVMFCDNEGSTVANVHLTTLPSQVVQVTWEPGTTNKRDLQSYLTFIVINTRENKAIVLRDIALRYEGTATFTLQKTWSGCGIALHVVTTDSTQLRNGQPGIIIKFRAGLEEIPFI